MLRDLGKAVGQKRGMLSLSPKTELASGTEIAQLVFLSESGRGGVHGWGEQGGYPAPSQLSRDSGRHRMCPAQEPLLLG